MDPYNKHISGVNIHHPTATPKSVLYGASETQVPHIEDYSQVSNRGFNDAYRKFDCSLDSDLILWNKGPAILSIVDKNTMDEYEQINQFWMYDKSICKPVCVIHNKPCTRILGFSEHFESLSNPYIVHYYQNDEDNYTLYSRRLRSLFPRIYCVNSCEISQDGQYALLAGVSNHGSNKTGKVAPGYPILHICKMNEKLYKVNSKILCHTQQSGFPSRIRRVKGCEIYLIGLKKHIFIYKFQNELLEHINTVENVHDNQILDFQLKNDYLYSIARDEPKLGMT